MTRDILIRDRIWFDQHPNAVVRFRRQHKDEFSTLQANGEEAPIFRPSFNASSTTVLTWVAVVDLFQLLQESNVSRNGTRLRLRIRTIPLYKAKHRALARKELICSVAQELLDQAMMMNDLDYGCDAA